MKIVRVPFAVSLTLLAAAPAHAAVPPPPPKPGSDRGGDPDRDAWRAQGVAICVGDMHGAEGVTPDELEATCGCAVDRFMPRWPTGALPALAPGRLRSTMGGELLACAAEQRPALVGAIGRQLAASGPVDAPPLVAPGDAKPAETPSSGPADAPNRSGADAGAWFDGLSLPSWITNSGLPAWAWVMLGFVCFMVLRGLLRGGNQRDLIGPPPNMRLGPRANQPAPPRADPPQRL